MKLKHKIHITFCHQMPERSFFWKGKQFPVCARCTGIHLGYLTLPLFAFNIIHLDLYCTFLFILPTYLDGFTQAFCNRESNNIIRVTTGFIAGVGSMSLSSIVGKYFGQQILTLFN